MQFCKALGMLLALLIISICTPCMASADDTEIFVRSECNYLKQGEDQSNAFLSDGQFGHICCMCPVGTKYTGICDSTDPTSTVCEPCEDGWYQDFQPHTQEICRPQILKNCLDPYILEEGSITESSKCICKPGTEEVSKKCKAIPVSGGSPITTTDSTILTKITQNLSSAKTTATTMPSTNKPNSTSTPENNEKDPKIIDKGNSDPDEIKGEDQEIIVSVSPNVNLTHVPSNTTIYIRNEDENQPDKFSTTMHVIAYSICGFIILALIILIILCVICKKIRTYVSQFLKRVKICPSESVDGVVRYDSQGLSSRHDDTTSLTAHSQSEEEANNSVDTVKRNEVQSLLPQSAKTEPDDPSDHNFYLSEEVEIVSEDIRINIDDVVAGQQQDVAQDEDSDTLTSVVVVETPERNREPETQKNMAGPIDSNNLGTTVDASNQQQLGTDFALQGSSLTQQDTPRISSIHKELRLIAVENIAADITPPDRMLFGHLLIQNDNELDSITGSYRRDGPAEVSRRVFVRGFQLNPNISLYELRDKAIGLKLGYLKDKFEEQITQLERLLAQEE